jgi:hypothetical protein
LGNGWLFTAPKGGWEYPVFLAAAAIVQALLGDGKYRLGAAIGWQQACPPEDRCQLLTSMSARQPRRQPA